MLTKQEKARLLGLLYHAIDRCHNREHSSYKYHGAKGIQVCAEWRYDTHAFVRWAEENGYAPGLYLSRRDQAKGFNPENCVFTHKSTRVRYHRKNKSLSVQLDLRNPEYTKEPVEWEKPTRGLINKPQKVPKPAIKTRPKPLTLWQEVKQFFRNIFDHL